MKLDSSGHYKKVVTGSLTDGKHSIAKLSACGLMALAALAPLVVLSPAGWPWNHEFSSFFTRTEVYASHFAAGDFLPVWSTLDNFGLGSPQPIFYHKLFYYVAGLALWLTGSMKAAVVFAIIGFLAIGITGIYCSLRDQGLARLDSAFAGVCFALANYSTTNWLVRGAVAEFSAAMVLTWVLLYFLRLWQQKPGVIGLGVSLWLTFLGHSVLAYFSVLLFTFAFLVANGWRLTSSGDWKTVYSQIKQAVGAGSLFLFLCSPWLLAMSAFTRDYELSRILSNGYHPTDQFREWWLYFWDDKYRFGERWESYTVQLDVAMLVIAAITMVTLATRRRLPAVAVPLLLIIAAALFLQHPWATVFYQYFPGAAFIQFPWRLLALLTPCLVLLAFVGASQALQKSRLVMVPALFFSIFFSGAFATSEYGRFTPAEIEQSRTYLDTATGTFSAFGEYADKRLPLDWISTVTSVKTDAPLKRALASWLDRRGCSVQQKSQAGEWQRAEFLVKCESGGAVVLPLLMSPFWTLTIENTASRCRSSLEMPGLCTVLVGSGETRISAQPPTIYAIVQHYWESVGLQQSFSNTVKSPGKVTNDSNQNGVKARVVNSPEK